MPVLKASDPLPERPVVIAIYGDPGSAKTTLGNTADNPIVIDFDRGISRSLHRRDAVIVNSWHDVVAEEQAGTFKGYKTVVIDTAKAALDDFLMSYVVERNFRLKTNKLQAFGEIGDEFKLFLNNRRNEGADVIIIAHAKKDDDTKKIVMDITGQSMKLVERVADQIGYVSFVNNTRTIQWSPTDLTIGKNTASLPTMSIPDKADPALKVFMAGVIDAVKKSIVSMSEAQKEALDKLESFKANIENAASFEELGMILPAVAELPVALQAQCKQFMESRGLQLIPAIKKVDVLNAALALFLSKPLQVTKPLMDAMKAVQDKHQFTFDKEKKVFSAPEKPKADDKDLKQAIPGASITDPPVTATAPQELQFS